MITKDIVGGIIAITILGLIAFGLWITKNPHCLWAIILVIAVVTEYPWSKSKKNTP
jgi:4-hydroxybenzoate polyprenyltransferase